MKINNEIECKAAFVRLDALIAGGFEGHSDKEREFTELALAIEAWEDRIPLMPIPVPRPPQTLTELLELTMFERKLKQRDLARLLDVPETRLSEVLRGKRKPNLDFIKRLHTRLGLDAEFMLKVA